MCCVRVQSLIWSDCPCAVQHPNTKGEGLKFVLVYSGSSSKLDSWWALDSDIGTGWWGGEEGGWGAYAPPPPPPPPHDIRRGALEGRQCPPETDIVTCKRPERVVHLSASMLQCFCVTYSIINFCFLYVQSKLNVAN